MAAKFLPDMNNRPLVDITFTDSLTGYSIISPPSLDSSFVLKTTNGGDNWNVILTETRVEYNRIIFLNNNTGYIGGSTLNGGAFTYLLKTINGGINWLRLNTPDTDRINDMAILNEDTIWYADESGFNGGIFRTTNGGLNWTYQGQLSSNIERIYMFNRNVGFASSQSYIYRTTNSGVNWNIIDGQNGYNDIFFIDSLTGWKCKDSMRMTSDGGLTWKRQYISNPNFLYGTMVSFSNIGEDTIWGIGDKIEYPNLQIRAIVEYTTNKGETWFFQIPDTSYKLASLAFSNFVNAKTGWEYNTLKKGIHTTTGGDSIFSPITGIYNQEIGSFILFQLNQNFPNPFNPKTKITYELKSRGDVMLKIFDIRGMEIETLINKKQSSGKYDVEFDGSGYSTGIYFYRMEINSGNETFIETKKMMLIK